MPRAKKVRPAPIWYRCPDCHISQSYGSIEYEWFNPKCPDCAKPMVKESA